MPEFLVPGFGHLVSYSREGYTKPESLLQTCEMYTNHFIEPIVECGCWYLNIVVNAGI